MSADRRAYQRAYYEAHREERKAYHAAHQEHRKAYMRAWHLAHRETELVTTRARAAIKRETFRQAIAEIKLARGCEHCGYNACAAALEFHHADGDKTYKVGDMHTSKWEAVEAEIAKCTVLCANCHREEHNGGHR